jgi:hypothetical protein
VTGTRAAGFGMSIILIQPAELEKAPPTGENKPDRIIHEFNELLDIFPARTEKGLLATDNCLLFS